MDAIEVTTFKLAPGLTIDDFVAANADVDAWLLRRPGFISRRIAQRRDGVVVDLLIWASVRDGETAAARLMDELAASPVHAAIDIRIGRRDDYDATIRDSPASEPHLAASTA